MSIAQLNSRIDQVKIYAQGSTVTRLAQLTSLRWHDENQQPLTSIEVEIVGLPLAIDDSSVRVRIEPETEPKNEPESRLDAAIDTTDRIEQITGQITEQIIVTDVKVGLSVPSPSEISPISSLATEIQTAKAEVAYLEDLQRQIDLEVIILEQLEMPERPMGEIGKMPPPSPTGARLALASFKEQQKRLHNQEKRQVQTKLRQAQEHLADLQQKQLLASNANIAKEHELRKTIIARLQRIPDQVSHQVINQISAAVPINEQSGGMSLPLASWQLVAEYFINGATWQPAYVCRLDSVNSRAEIAVRALIAQNTGEDWHGVKIELSTAEPTTWCELPELPALRLGRSQTLPPKKAWRSPPEGVGLLFDDYDRQKKHLEAHQIQGLKTAHLDPIHIPHLTAPNLINMDVTNLSSFAQSITSLRYASSQSPATSAMSMAPPSGEFGSQPQPAPAPVDDLEEPETFISFLSSPADDVSRSIMPQASRSLGSIVPKPKFTVAEPTVTSGLPRKAPEQDDSPSKLAFQASQNIYDYRLMRLVEPSNIANRGLPMIPESKLLYLESLQRWQVKVNFDLAMVLARANQNAGSIRSHAQQNIREAVGNFDFVYLGRSRIDVPSDGQYHSIALLKEDTAIDLRYVVVPRESRAVFRIAQLHNPLAAPLITGPADMYVDGQYLFSTNIATVPPKGKMELALGVEQAIKVARNTSFKEVRSSMSLVAFNEFRHSIAITVSNPMAKNASVEVRERIPVPRSNEKVDVTITRVMPNWEKYEQQEQGKPIEGGYRWQIQVPAGMQRELSVDYTIKTFVDQELVHGNRREN